MKRRKVNKALKIVIITLISLLVIAIILYFTLPAKARNFLLRQYVYTKIPIGTSWDEAIDIIEKDKKWEIRYTYMNNGIRIGENGEGINVSEPSADDIGVKNHTY